MPRLSLDLLRGFRLAARHLSFTRAAQELFVTQSAISREIGKLEEQLGKPLFLRVNRSLVLTPAGQELYRAVDEALGLIDDATRRVASASRTLAVTTSVPLASLWLGPRLPGFARAHPEIDMRVTASNDILDMERERIDIAIRYAPTGHAVPAGDKLFDLDAFPVCSPALARDSARPIRTPADLSRHVLLDLDTIRNGRPWGDWSQWFASIKVRDVAPAGSLRFSHYDQVIQAAIEGSGIAIGKYPHVLSHLQAKALVAPLGDAGVARMGVYYVVVSDRAERDLANALVSWLHVEAKQDRAPARRKTKPNA